MRILSVNLGGRREVLIKHRPVQTSIYKTPVTGRVRVHRLGLGDDARVEPRTMGAEHHAVYVYPHEHYAHWQQVLGREPFPMGQFGENLTTRGLLEDAVRIGDVLRFGSAILQVAHPRIPCAKLNQRMGLHFSSMFLASRKVGFYLRVLREGTVGENDSIELLERDPASPTVEAFVRLTHYEYWDAQGLLELLDARDLMPAWREIIEAKLARALAASGWQGLREFELVAREEEGANIVSLRLKCLRGRPLAPFHGGQQLGIVLGGRSAHQQRRAYALSGNPHELSTYRITLRAPSPGESQRPDRAVAAHLAGMQVGEHVLCTAPHWTSPQIPQSLTVRIPVLLGRGLGIAPLLSLLHEYAAQPAPVWLYHEAGEHDPQALLREARALAAGNSGIHLREGTSALLDSASICRGIPPEQAEFHIAGPDDFVKRMVRELNAACPVSAIRIVQNLG